ncbi:MAG: hypothetical protein R3F14_03010 [Polyangiaceae bacterium]
MIQALAEKFGLSLERRALQPHCAAGELDGQRVIAAISSQGTLIDAVLRPPLDLGLSLSTRAFTFAPTFGRRIHLGDSSWDDELNATADEPDRARVLFRDSDLRGAVLMLNATNLGFEMTDHRVRILVGMNQFEDAGAALPKVARVANLVAAARRPFRRRVSWTTLPSPASPTKGSAPPGRDSSSPLASSASAISRSASAAGADSRRPSPRAPWSPARRWASSFAARASSIAPAPSSADRISARATPPSIPPFSCRRTIPTAPSPPSTPLMFARSSLSSTPVRGGHSL